MKFVQVVVDGEGEIVAAVGDDGQIYQLCAYTDTGTHKQVFYWQVFTAPFGDPRVKKAQA